MVISHKYKYVFIEFPLTGSTSVSKALVENYDGTRILHKHSSYFDFAKIATVNEKKYFIFSTIRNPLDQAVSRYFKYKNDHYGRYTGFIKSYKFDHYIYQYQIKRYKYVSNSKSFNDYFLKFYKLPYNSWSTISHPYCDYVMRFENLNYDYEEALKRIGIKNPLPLQVVNKTNKENTSFVPYYSQDSIKRAKKVFAIYMSLIGYEFPSKWGEVKVTSKEKILFRLQNTYKSLYWKYLRFYVHKLEKI